MKETADGLNPDHFVTAGEYTAAIIEQLPLEEITAADEAAVRKFVKECGVLLVSSDDDSGDDSGDDAQAAPARAVVDASSESEIDLSGCEGSDEDPQAAPANGGAKKATRAAGESSSESELDLSEPPKRPRAKKMRKKNPTTPCHAEARPVLEARFKDVKATVDAAPLQTWTNAEPTPNPGGACIQQKNPVCIAVVGPDGSGEVVVVQPLRKGNGTRGMPEKQYKAFDTARDTDDLDAHPEDVPTTTPPVEHGGCTIISNGSVYVAPAKKSYFAGKKNPPNAYLVSQGPAEMVTLPSGIRVVRMTTPVTKYYNTGSSLAVLRSEFFGDVDDIVLNMVLRVAEAIGWSNVRIVINDGQSQSDKDMTKAITKSLRKQYERIEARNAALQAMNNVAVDAMPTELDNTTAALPLMIALTFAANKRGTAGESWEVVKELHKLANEIPHAPIKYPTLRDLMDKSTANPAEVIDDIAKMTSDLLALAEDPLSKISQTAKVVIGKLAMVSWGLTSESLLDRQQTLFACKLVLWRCFEVNELKKTQEQLAICTKAIGEMRALAASGTAAKDMIDEILADVRAEPTPKPAVALAAGEALADKAVEQKLIYALRNNQPLAKETLVVMLKREGEITEDGGKLDYKHTMPKAASAYADSITQDEPCDWDDSFHVFIKDIIEKAKVGPTYMKLAELKMKLGYNHPVGAARSTLFATAAGEIIEDARKRAAEVEKEQEAIRQTLEQNAASALASRPKRKRRAPRRYDSN